MDENKLKKFVFTAFSGMLCFIPGNSQKKVVTRPNILLIHADELRFDCLGVTGNKDVRTPNINALARDGILYQNSFTAYPVSTPSRYTLLSGLYVNEHQGWTNHCTLNPDIQTFPDLLKAAGYKTKAVGKCHFAPTYLDAGFTDLVLAEQDGPGRLDDDYHRDLMKNGLIDRTDLQDQVSSYRAKAGEEYFKSFGTIPSALPDTFSSTRWISERALETIKTWGQSGNMLMVGFIKPHHPFDPTDSWKDMYEPGKLTLLPGWTGDHSDALMTKGYFPNKDLTEEALRKAMAYYYASISEIDSEVGEMIRVLKEKGIYDQTMIIFTSDHGEHMGYHHQLLKGGEMLESIMRVPLIIKYPGNKKKGTVNKGLVSNTDVAPTILLQSGIKPPEEMTGTNLFRDKIPREIVFAHNNMGKSTIARTHTRKLIYNPGGRSLYFDLEKDPYEFRNLYYDPAYSQEIEKLKKSIIEWQGGETPTVKVYLDENAPVINSANVPSMSDDHREVISKYFLKMMNKEDR